MLRQAYKFSDSYISRIDPQENKRREMLAELRLL